MALYLLLFFLSLLLAVYENQKLDYYGNITLDVYQRPLAYPMVWFMFAAFMCIVGFRYKLGGTDYICYHSFYELIKAKHSFWTAISTTQYEIGYTTFVYLCAKILHLSYEGSLVIEAFIFYILMYEGLKKYIPNWGLFFMFFIYKMFFYVTFVAMRQAFTIAGFFVIMRYLEERKWIKYYASLVLVATFHYGALILFVLYPFFRLRISKKRLLYFGVIFAMLTLLSNLTGNLLNFVVNLLGLNQLEDKAADYSSFKESLNILYTIEYFMLYVLVVKHYDDLKERFANTDFWVMMFLMVLPIVTLFRSTLILVRELFYFYPAYAVLVYYLYYISRSRIAIFSVFVSICLLGMLKFIIQFDDGHFMHYKTWLFDSSINFFQ